MTPTEAVTDRSLPTRGDGASSALSLTRTWRELCAVYLPIAPENSKWRYSRKMNADDLEQGWKLHLSATVLTACNALRRVAPFLTKQGVLFKAPASLQELGRINSGIHHGYSQVGKFITVYPSSDKEAVRLAQKLHVLTAGMTAPAVPFDLHLRSGSCVYYRYGAFRHLELEEPDGSRVPAIMDLDGNMIPDVRQAASAKPEWVADPFNGKRRSRSRRTVDSPLKTTFPVFRALTQRGKGGVYQAVDLSVNPPRLCVVKEGRSGGEVGWDGRDGYWRVRNEERVLASLEAAGIAVPRVFSSFEVEGNYYLVTEFIEGENLNAILSRRQRLMTVEVALRLGIQLSRIVAQIHAAGWVWRDCKPANIVVTTGGELRPLDFESGCPIDRPDLLDWCTPEFAPPDCSDYIDECQSVAYDLYALGAIMYFLLTGTLAVASQPVTTITKLRRNVSLAVRKIIEELLDPDPERRPAAEVAVRRFERGLSSLRLMSQA